MNGITTQSLKGLGRRMLARRKMSAGERMIVKTWMAATRHVFAGEALLRGFYIILGALFFLHAPGAYGQSSPPPAGTPGMQPTGTDAAGVEELIKILVAKGLLRPEEAAAMAARKGEAGFSALAALTEMLKNKGLLSGDEAASIAGRQPEGAAGAIPPAEKKEAAPPKKVQIVTRGMKKEDREKIKEEIKEEVVREARQEIKAYPLPDWAKRIRFYGDIRLRYEGDFFSKNNAQFVKPSDPAQLLNSQNDRQRFSVRGRFGASAAVNDFTEVGLRLTTGNLNDPLSTSQTLGTYENKYSVSFDLAYLKVNPLPGFALIGGRVPNPWFFSELVWYSSLTFDGFVADYRTMFSPVFGGFLTAGAFPLQEIEFSQKDKWLFGGQAGLEFKPRRDLSARLGVAYYHYQNTRGIANTPAQPNQYDYTAPQFQQKGNTLFDIDPSPAMKLALAADYHELDIIAAVDIGIWDPIHIVLLGDYVQNIGFNRSEVAALTGNPEVQSSTMGYQTGLSVGHLAPYKFGAWRVYAYYRYLQADAVLDAFTDPYFHLGGTNAKGWILGGELGLARNLWLAARWLTTNAIEGPPFAVDVVQVELLARF